MAIPGLILFSMFTALSQQIPSVVARGESAAVTSTPPPPSPPSGSCGGKLNKDCGCGGLNRNSMMGRISHRLTGITAKEEYFSGGLLGVHAEVVLMRQSNEAQITLSGLPIGGTATGEATFADGVDGAESGAVVVSGPLAGVLRRRAVKLMGAEYDRVTDTVRVVARLPIVGVRQITLQRKSKV